MKKDIYKQGGIFMKWLKGNLIMACLALMVACMAFMFNGSVADAMTLQDLQGTYRVMSSEQLHMIGVNSEGTFVNMVYNNGDLVGTVNKPGSKSNLEAGQEIIADVFVSDNKVTCTWTCSAGIDWSDCEMISYNNGNIIKIVHRDFHSWTMKRVA